MLDSILELVYLADAALALPDFVWISHLEGYTLENNINIELGDTENGLDD